MAKRDDTSAQQVQELSDRVAVLQEQLDNSGEESFELRESLSNLSYYIEAQGWSTLAGVAEEDGPSLDQLHTSSKRVRQMKAMNAHVKRAFDLRFSYVWHGGIHYDESKFGNRPGNRGQVSQVWGRVLSPANQQNFFSQAARERREAALFTDSQAFIVGDDADYTLRQLPIEQITGYYLNPDYTDEIWAYRRSWTPQSTVANPTPQEKVEWIWVNTYWDKRTATINISGTKREPVSKTKRMFGRPVNSNPGWPLGVPDALGGMGYAEQYRQFLLSGKQMSDAMAKIWAKATANTKQGASGMGARLAQATPEDKVFIGGPANEITPLSTSGQSYDFAKGLPLLAPFAASVGVSVVALTADPGSAGASYGSAKALDLPEQMTTTARRQFHIDLDREILKWLGVTGDIDIWFDPIKDSSEIYREIQAIMLEWGFGGYEPEEIKAELMAVRGRRTVNKIPEGIQIPNNIRFPGSLSNDTPPASSSNGGNFTPTQGSGSGFSGGGSNDQNASDLRTDILSK